MPTRNGIGRKLLWGGVLGGGLAWSGQLVAGYGLEEIACSPGSAGSQVFGIPVSDLIYGLSAAAAALTLVAIAICLGAVRRTRGSHDHRDERIAFMGITGIAANLLFLAVIAYGAIAPLYLASCRPPT
ncbi:MAG: hypothetical protein M3290_10775 [Actinomycetota bacterium]|nr:hypothetical protein [Actinomycetota bacterium]